MTRSVSGPSYAAQSALGGRWAAPRIAVGGIAHETNTFSPQRTTLDDFAGRAYLLGEDLVRRNRGARNVLGGAIAEADARGALLLPTLFASAMPAGLVEGVAWDTLRRRLIDRLLARHRGPRPLDGVLLVLHGAMVAEGEEDPEGRLLEEVRTIVGTAVPIVATLDFHANVTTAMVRAADLLVGYRTYPHLDTVERGRDAVAALLRLKRRGARPAVAFRPVPLLAPLPPQRTGGGTPMAEVAARAAALTRTPGVADVAVAGGFPYADVAGAGVSVRVATDDDPSLAAALADGLAAAIWDRRHRFRGEGLTPDTAIDRALGGLSASGPVVLADVGDNPGAGAAGTGTALLGRLIARRVPGAAYAAFAEPTVVALAIAAGEGFCVPFRLGGDSANVIQFEARVLRLTDGVFTARGPMASGGPTRLGRTALLSVGGVDVVVCERRAPAIDPELFRSVGVEPTARRVLAVKSSVHFRAAFEPLAAAVIEVETSGLSSSNLAAFPYHRVRRPIYPLDDAVAYGD